MKDSITSLASVSFTVQFVSNYNAFRSQITPNGQMSQYKYENFSLESALEILNPSQRYDPAKVALMQGSPDYELLKN